MNNDPVEELPSARVVDSTDLRPRPFERRIDIDPAFDRRHPDPKQNYGIHGVTMRFILKGDKGAVQFVLFTNWQLPHVTEETDQRTIAKARAGEDISIDLRCFYRPLPADRGYHSPTPVWEGQESRECDLLDGKPCYYDGSGLQAETVYHALLAEGGEGVWKELEYYYSQVFETPLEERTSEGAEFGLMIRALGGGLHKKKTFRELSGMPEGSSAEKDDEELPQ